MVNYIKYSDIEIFEGKVSKHKYPWHFHNCYTLIFVEKGSVKYEFKEKSIKIDEAEAIIIEPLKVHRNTISRYTAYKAIFIPREYLEKYIFTLKVTNTNVVDSLADLFKKVKLNYDKNEIKKVISEICEILINSQVEKIADSSLINHEVPKIKHDLSIKELAEEAHLSKFHFQRKFKKNCGLTIGQLKLQEKAMAAKALLEKGKLSTDVAYELGFFDQSHFIRYFKKMWATTPRNFK